MFSQSDEPINENASEKAAPTEISAAPVESAEPEAVIETGIDTEPVTPALGERETRNLAELIDRVGELTSAIERFPDSPANYVLRGEMFLEGGDNDLAVTDFETAIRLAEHKAQTADWGYIYRALADRAREGLRRA